MTMFKRLFLMFAALALAGCGGGGGSAGGTDGGPAPTPPTAVADLVVVLSSATIPNVTTSIVTATVTALDANRNAVASAPVTLAADNDAVVTIAGTTGSVTDSNGQVRASVTIGSNTTPRVIKLTASTGGLVRTANLQVIVSPGGARPTSIELIASTTTAGTGGDAVLITAFVKDASNNALPTATVAFTADTGTLSGVSSSTNALGAATANFSAGADRSNRTATITVTSGTVTSTLRLPVTGTKLSLSGPSALILGNSAAFDLLATDSKGAIISGATLSAASSLGNPITASGSNVTNASGVVRFTYVANNAGTDSLVFSGAGATISPSPALVVSGQDFAFVSPAAGSTVAVNTSVPVQVRLRNGGAPQAGAVVTFATTGGTLSPNTATTNSAGIAQVSFLSASAGPVTIQATVGGSSTNTTLPLTVIATTPANLVLQVSQTALAPNLTAGSANQAQVIAKVTDPAGNPVQGQTVNFTRQSDPSGGNLLQASALTDSNGQASVTYRSGAQSTANNGVVLSATVAGTSVSGTATLTVNQSSLFIALGTGNTITNLDPQTYKKDWVVYVTDANGIPVNGATLTIKAIPTRYFTGRLVFVDPVWVYSTPIYACRNEDRNTNGILDAGEDDNGDGVLWPGNVISVTPGSVQTADGRATISLIYAESYAPWVELQLTASALVSGTESKTSVEFIVSGSAEDFSNASVPPAGRVSPYGLLPKTGAVCTQFQ